MATVPAAADSLPGNANLESPNWDHVPFAVGCARCGADLRGTTEPKCASCGLEFDWADAVPIDKLTCAKCGYHLRGLRRTRCPECGNEFTWDEALARYHRTRLPYFEYRWRDQPVRSFVRTWWLSLWPRKLWRTMQLHDPPQTQALIFQTFAWLVLLVVIVLLLDMMDTLFWMMRSGQSAISSLPVAIFYSFHRTELPVFIGLWWASAFGAMLIFQQSMQRIHVRANHLSRMAVYALPATLAFALPACYLVRNVIALCHVRYPWGSTYFFPSLADGSAYCAGLVALHSTWSLRCAYKRYLKMPHSAGVAAAIQVIALLGAGAILFVS